MNDHLNLVKKMGGIHLCITMSFL